MSASRRGSCVGQGLPLAALLWLCVAPAAASAEVLVVDLVARKEVAAIATGRAPDGVVWAATRASSGRSRIAFTIPEKDLIPEGIAYDPVTKSFFVSSTHKRKIVRVDAGGRCTDFTSEAQEGLAGVVGMRVDARRRLLWAVSSDAGEDMPMKNMVAAERDRSAVFKYDLRTGNPDDADDERLRLAAADAPDPEFLDRAVAEVEGHDGVEQCERHLSYSRTDGLKLRTRLDAARAARFHTTLSEVQKRAGCVLKLRPCRKPERYSRSRSPNPNSTSAARGTGRRSTGF
jgi:hypothetical protein